MANYLRQGAVIVFAGIAVLATGMTVDTMIRQQNSGQSILWFFGAIASSLVVVACGCDIHARGGCAYRTARVTHQDTSPLSAGEPLLKECEPIRRYGSINNADPVRAGADVICISDR